MTVAASLVVEISGRDVNLAALLQRVQAQLQQANTAGTRTAGVLGGTLTTSQERAANSALALAAAYSRLALAEGDPARAASILRTALDSNVGASERLQVSLQATATRLETGRTAFQQFGDAAKGSLLGIVGPAAAVGVALSTATRVVQSFEEAIKFKAELDVSKASIDTLLRGVRDSGETWAGAARFANEYKLTQQQTTEAIQASVPVIRNSKASIEEIMGAFARLKVMKPEKTFGDAARAIDELRAGQIISIVDQFNVSRAAANKMKDEIAHGADAVQVLNAYLDKTGVTMDAVKAQTTGAMGAMKDLAKAQEDLTLAQAQFAQGPGLAILNERITVTRGLTRGLSGDTQQMGASLQQAALQGTTSYQGLLSALGPVGAALQQVTDFARAHQEAQAAEAAQTQATASVIASHISRLEEDTQATDTNSGAQAQLAAQIAAATAAVATHAAEVATAAQEAVNDAYAKQEQSAATEVLRQKTDDTVNSFLNLYPALTAQELAGLAAARGYSAAEVKLITMAGAARDATNALIVLHNQMNAVSVGAAVAASRASGRIGRGDSSDMRDMAAGNKAYADALQEQIDKTGTAAEKQRALNYEVQKAKLYYGQDSAEYIRAKTALDAYTASQEKHGRAAKGGGGGGGVKLSDQTKLNNSLLAQQEQADNRLEDAEVRHTKRLLDIDRDTQRKMQAAWNQYHQGRLDGEAGFYESLGSVGSSGNAKADADLRKQLSARYEAAAATADTIAAEKGADAGQAYLEAAAQAIQKEGELQDKINKAKQEKNTGEAEYLTGVLALQKKADDARLAQIEAQGSAIAAERQKALDDENAQYEEQTGKIVTASDRAAEAKILNAQRAGKAIDAENLKLQEQEDRLKRIGGAAGGVSGSGATAAPTQGTAPPASAAAPPGGGIDLGGAFEALRAAVAGVEAAVRATGGDVTSAQRDTTRAVRGLSNGGGVIA